ncbi:MAG: endonuclease/exonuclease/phosphatase family protein [Rhodobacteraceae bacterium]|nr:endonuclease/exonuclease/phosphatase family protein [Paracoccaceae bacterium]MCP5341148.1 endonuclease/exonuclease/phosphatase family protein [Paracoccaceae bacterium]
MLLAAMPVTAAPIRVATFNADMSRQGPGLLLRDILSGTDAQTIAVVDVISRIAPDILLLNGFDYDLNMVALQALAGALERRGNPYPHLFARRPNTGLATGLDLDGDGRAGGPGDAQGFGRFAGEGGMAVLSRLPIDQAAAQDYSEFLWKDLPESLIDGARLSSGALAAQRLSTTAHWTVPVALPNGGRLTLLAYHASPPVFDGPEDRNGRRSHDETAFWLHLLDGDLAWPAPRAPFVILGDANLDPVDGDGRHAAMISLLADPRLQDPAPRSRGAAEAARQGGVNALNGGDPALDTVDWPEDPGPGNLRVDYVLPSADLTVLDAGVWWPEEVALAVAAAKASRHKLVWVDIDLP